MVVYAVETFAPHDMFRGSDLLMFSSHFADMANAAVTTE
jgi:hypothetical protein